MTEQHTFVELMELARGVAAGFGARQRRPWTIQTDVLELVKHVGELTKHVLVAEAYYLPDRDSDPRYATTTAEISDELADILYCLVRVATMAPWHGVRKRECQSHQRPQ